MAKLVAALVLVVLVFGAYGAKELVQAYALGTSPKDGYEALVVAAVLLVTLAVVLILRRRHVRRA
jgi:hypothetical protein